MKNLTIALTLCTFALAFIMSGCTPPCTNGIRDSSMVISMNALADLLNNEFARARVRLNNYTPNANEFYQGGTFKYRRDNDSFLELPDFQNPTGNPLRRQISLEPIRRRDPYTVYVIDINTTGGFSFALVGDSIRARITFESDGLEFWANCVENAVCAFVGNNKDIQMNNATLDIFLPLATQNANNLLLTRQRWGANLTADISEAGQDIETEIENNAVRLFNNTDLLLGFSRLLRQKLVQLGVPETMTISSIRKIEDSNDNDDFIQVSGTVSCN